MEIIQTFSSPIYTSLQTNVAFEETVALLLKCFITLSRAGEELPGNLSIPFSIILPPLVAAHPDPPMRHLLFRLLSIFLSLLMAKYRLQVLEDLLTNTAVHTPQMRIAAIGLVKDSVLETLNSSTRLEPSYDVFGTSLCLDRLDHVLFRLDPLDLFQSTGFNVDEFAQSPEPKRLVESLALYYVVMQRDTENRVSSVNLPIFKHNSLPPRLVFGIQTGLRGWRRIFFTRLGNSCKAELWTLSVSCLWNTAVLNVTEL